jgi:ubiquinone/menaquinone biosynthesis C-methylase UbiE
MTDTLQEQQASAAFSKQAPVFDKIDEENQLIGWMRNRIYGEVMRFLRKDDYLLELNCGTGIDAAFFASQGIRVMATDNAPGMLEQLQQKITALHLKESISAKRCSFNNLGQMGAAHQYDYVFSNFGGLNCTDRLDEVLADIDRLLKPGGRFTLVIMPKVCPWEILMLSLGYFKTAFRRFRKGGTDARLEGLPFRCYYYSPRFIQQKMGKRYQLLSLGGLAITVPPPFIGHFIERHPKLFRRLERWENKLWHKAPFNRWCDHFIITMEKKP